MGIGGGPYAIVGEQYNEHIEFIYPQDLDLIGVNAVYNWKQDHDNHWNISGVVENRKAPQKREENWERYKAVLESEAEAEPESMN